MFAGSSVCSEYLAGTTVVLPDQVIGDDEHAHELTMFIEQPGAYGLTLDFPGNLPRDFPPPRESVADTPLPQLT